MHCILYIFIPMSCLEASEWVKLTQHLTKLTAYIPLWRSGMSYGEPSWRVAILRGHCKAEFSVHDLHHMRNHSVSLDTSKQCSQVRHPFAVDGCFVPPKHSTISKGSWLWKYCNHREKSLFMLTLQHPFTLVNYYNVCAIQLCIY